MCTSSIHNLLRKIFELVVYYFCFQLVIDIGRSVAPGSGVYYSNQVAAETTSVFGRQNNYPPPPYSGQSATIGFCSRCNAPRQDFIAKFCPSCGNSFSIY